MLTLQADEIWSDRGYHRVRAREELERARAASSICARRAHLELARLHTRYVGCGRGSTRTDPFLDARYQAVHPTRLVQDV